MSADEIVCPACSCLCEDIAVEIRNNRFSKIANACVRGAAFLYASDDFRHRTTCIVGGRRTSLEEAIEKAALLLSNAKNPLIFGLDNSTSEAQAAGINLAQALGAVIDDTSSFCQGPLIRYILNGEIASTSLSSIADAADLLIYWGSNPHHTHPRHLSKFSYYAHHRYREAGWIPHVTLSCVEVRNTEMTSLANPVFTVKPGGDGEFIQAILNTMQGKSETSQARMFVETVRRSVFCAVFVGLGLIYALGGDMRLFLELIRAMQKLTRVVVIPMGGHFNMRGLNSALYSATGYVNKVSFADGIAHGEEFSFIEQLRRQMADCVLIIGSDPMLTMPQSLIKNLHDVSLICIDPFATLTTSHADVVFETAISGVEVGGKAVRMDGEEVILSQVKTTGLPSDEAILKRLLDEVMR